MKVRVADYIADFLSSNGITDVFTVTGGGAMHLNDALGHHKGLRCTYNHHEQACAIAGESYARIHNRIPLVCVTTGPGGTNAMTGVVGAYLDSIPMIVISGQVRYDTTARSTGLSIRAMGDQEFDICKAAQAMTKYCEMVTDPAMIRYCLQKALFIAQNGRPGPVWLDIPLNVQGAYIETDSLLSYNTKEYSDTLPDEVSDSCLDEIIDRINNAKRPVLNIGNGVRIAGAHKELCEVIEKLSIPVVTGWNSIDAIYDEHPL
ncbi:MAG: thiamine pyrophosphate-binding protein, partial [Oscillospiraceae bacterium]|nr:thiamine pyrophosphate-binding protein [Oscillospiraceae bacterium]